MTKTFEPGTKVIFVGATGRKTALALGYQGVVVGPALGPRRNKAGLPGPWYRIDTPATKAMFPEVKQTILYGVPHQVLRRLDDPPKVETPETSEEIPA